MPKCLIVYFSQMGSTAKVAESIARGLKTEGYQVDLHDLKNGKPPEVADYDLLGIGSPIYAYTQPSIVLDYVRSFTGLKGLAVFVLNTFGTYRFDAANILVKYLLKKQARLVGVFACHGTGSYLGYLKLGYLFSPDHPKSEDLIAAEEFGHEISARVKGKPYGLAQNEKGAPFIYRLERFLLNRWLTAQVYSRFFSADNKTCNACGLCTRVCPVGNIRKDRDGRPSWRRGCIGCLMCQLRCPKDSIKSPADWLILRPFLAYNVRTASRDKALEYVKVKHRQGKTERI